MPDSRARYLAQQRELGTDEVLLSRKRGEFLESSAGRLVGSLDGAVSQPTVAASTRRAEPLASDQPSGRPNDDADDASWRKGAPAIPGLGLTVDAGPLDPAIAGLTTLEAVAAVIAQCQKCPLAPTRKHTVPGEGNPRARLMFVGEGPGATEDETGRPFVGAAGDLLNKIIASIGMRREDVYIANIVKCRPPQNRKPLPDESAACLPYLHRQIQLVEPRVLVALGGTAAESLLGARRSLTELRGKVHRYLGIPLVATYHPAALLRNPNWKKPTWDDIRIARQLLDH